MTAAVPPLLERWGKAAGYGMAIVGFAGFVGARAWWATAAVVGHVQQLAAHDAAVDARLDGLALSIDALRADLAAAAVPDDVFVLSPTSRPKAGYCVAGEPCTFIVAIRRTPEGLPCEPLPERTRHHFYSADLTQAREVERLDDESQVRVQDRWVEGEITVRTPSDLPQDARYAFFRAYDRCLGPDDPTVVGQESPLIPVPIFREQPR